MATYNLQLTSTQLTTDLTPVKSLATIDAINYALGLAHLAPIGAGTLNTVFDTTSGGNAFLSGSGNLFVYEGATGTTVDAFSVGGNVLVDPGNITDFGPGHDTLVSGGGSTMTVAFGNNLLLSTGGDTLVGGFGADTMWGFGGDLMVAGAGNTAIHGGQTSIGDTLVGGAGADNLGVLQGNNLLQAGSGLNTLWGGSGSDDLWGGGQSSLVAGSGMETLHGGADANAHDTLVAGSGNDVIGTVAGHNSIVAGAGNTVIYSGGTDTITTGAGNATIFGGAATVVNESQAAGNIMTDTTVGGVREITFSNNQKLDVAGGGTINFGVPHTTV